MRILVVEDERDLNRIITKKLKAEGYGADACFDGEEALAYLRAASYDAVIMDIMMPKKDGLSVLRELRASGDTTPVLFLTARDALEDRVRGLDLGADDYLVKPFHFEELMARLRSLIRRRHGAAANRLTVGDLCLDLDTHLAERNGKKIELTAREFSILEYLMQNTGIVLSRERIEEHILDFAYQGASNMIDVYIRHLRQKIDEGYSKKLIHTVRGAGYVLREEID